MNDAPEPFLQVRRHVSCCGMTYALNRYPRFGGADDAQLEAQAVAEVEAWAKIHSMTCRALKVTDELE